MLCPSGLISGRIGKGKQTVAPVTSSKYDLEVALEFRSLDRFLYRVSDLNSLGDELELDAEIAERLDNCHLYLLGKRPRLSFVPGSLRVSDDSVACAVAYSIEGVSRSHEVTFPRHLFLKEEQTIEVSSYPHRELVSRDSSGTLTGTTLLANHAHQIPDLDQRAKDLEIVYVGKGLRRSAQDRLKHHSTLQEILADINSYDPDSEVFALVYAFEYKKPGIASPNVPGEITGQAAGARLRRARAYAPSIDQQIALVEAASIAYFQTSRYNSQYLDFPRPTHRILREVYKADFAALIVNIDSTDLGGLRTYSEKAVAAAFHPILVDFRKLENRSSWFRQSGVPG
jgi:hypothetical protein